MKHVLRDQRELDRLVDRNVQRVDLVLAARMLGLPHPLLADDVDIHRVGRRRVHAEVDERAPDKHHQEESQRDDRPCRFQQRRAFDLHGHGVALLAVENREAGHEQNHDRQTDEADQDDEEIQRVHLRRNLRRLRRKEREVRQPLDEVLPKNWTDLRHSVIRSPLVHALVTRTAPYAPAGNPCGT